MIRSFSNHTDVIFLFGLASIALCLFAPPLVGFRRIVELSIR